MDNSQERRDLLGLVAAMPEEQVREVLAFTRQVLAKARIDISYEWSDEDLADFSRASMDYANRVMPWEGDDFPEAKGDEPR